MICFQGLYLGSDDLNMARWNSTYPPAYKYEGITAPVALFWGQNDWLVVLEDEAVLVTSTGLHQIGPFTLQHQVLDQDPVRRGHIHRLPSD